MCVTGGGDDDALVGDSFMNPCLAECAGAATYTRPDCNAGPGECERSCELGAYEDYETGESVCGSDGVEYPSVCLAHCAGADVPAIPYTGPCDLDGPCDDERQKPVCGADGKTYASACAARRAPVRVVFEGECMKECDCTAHTYEPVCGIDANTYINECFSRCVPVALRGPGECE